MSISIFFSRKHTRLIIDLSLRVFPVSEISIVVTSLYEFEMNHLVKLTNKQVRRDSSLSMYLWIRVRKIASLLEDLNGLNGFIAQFMAP